MKKESGRRNYQKPRKADLSRIPKKAVRNPDVLCEAYHYENPVAFSRGIRVELGVCSLILISGTASVDEKGRSIHPGDFKAQTRRAYGNIASLLAAEGADWHDVVRTTCYLVDFRHYKEFNEVRNEFYNGLGLSPLPASTCVQAGLCRPELLVEIDALAVIPNNRKQHQSRGNPK